MKRRLLPLLLATACWLALPAGIPAARAQAAPAQGTPPIVPPAATMPPATAAATPPTPAPAANPFRLSLNLEGTPQKGSVSVAVQIVILMTLLTLAPSILILMTSFTRIVIVLGFVRTALGVPNAPANQIVIGLSLFLTFFIMGPVFSEMNTTAFQPYLAGKMTSTAALDAAAVPLKQFMLRQTRTQDMEFFLELGKFGPTQIRDLPMRVVLPAFVVSELQTAFQMGFLLFLPFLIIDLLVSSVLMALGMMMMPPVVVSLPFKLLLFVLVDGWHLVVRSLVLSFH